MSIQQLRTSQSHNSVLIKTTLWCLFFHPSVLQWHICQLVQFCFRENQHRKCSLLFVAIKLDSVFVHNISIRTACKPLIYFYKVKPVNRKNIAISTTIPFVSIHVSYSSVSVRMYEKHSNKLIVTITILGMETNSDLCWILEHLAQVMAPNIGHQKAAHLYLNNHIEKQSNVTVKGYYQDCAQLLWK